MRSFLAVTFLLATGCVFTIDRNTRGPDGDDTAAVVDTAVAETGGVRDCDPIVRAALLRLPGPSRSCVDGWAATTTDVGADELTLLAHVEPDLFVSAGESFTLLLDPTSLGNGYVRLSVGHGQYDAVCGGPTAAPASHVWLSVSGELVVTRTAGTPDAEPRVVVSTRGVVVDDGSGGSCRIPDVTFGG